MEVLSLFSPKEFDSEYVVKMNHLGRLYNILLALRTGSVKEYMYWGLFSLNSVLSISLFSYVFFDGGIKMSRHTVLNLFLLQSGC